MLLDAFQRGEPMTNIELLKTVKAQYNSKLIKGWLHSFIGWHLDVLQQCFSFPLEGSRLTVPREQLEEHINTVKTILAGKFSELVFNLDEIESSTWEEWKPKKIIAPRSIPADQCFILSPEGIVM
jgi:hypothetical protein